MVVFNNSRFSAKTHHHLPPKLNAGEHIFNLANTYKTIIVAFYNHFKFQNILYASFLPRKSSYTLVCHIFLKIHPIAIFGTQLHWISIQVQFQIK